MSLIEELGTRIAFIQDARDNCGKCDDAGCLACQFYLDELALLQKCREQLRWVPVEEALPEDYDPVLVCCESFGELTRKYRRFVTVSFYKDGWGCEERVVGWMKFPDPPQGEE